jgi:Pyridoxamine 5'-phosphate oxidase
VTISLPELPVGTVVILATVGVDGPHAIPVSAARFGSGELLLALSRTRDSVTRVRAQPRVAVTIVETGIAQTIRGSAHVACEELPGAEFMAVIAVTIDAIDDHLRPQTRIESGVRWAWADPDMAAKDRSVLAALDAFLQTSR